MDDKKRKLFHLSSSEEVERDDQMMVLFKRMHLEKTSELYEKEPLSQGKLTPKRWRLSPIQEIDIPSVPAKRRRIDSDMAEEMSNSLWISEKYSPSRNSNNNSVKENVLKLDQTSKIEFNVNIDDVMLTLEGKFLRNKLREDTLQVVEWRPHPLQLIAPSNDTEDSYLPGEDPYNDIMF